MVGHSNHSPASNMRTSMINGWWLNILITHHIQRCAHSNNGGIVDHWIFQQPTTHHWAAMALWQLTVDGLTFQPPTIHQQVALTLTIDSRWLDNPITDRWWLVVGISNHRLLIVGVHTLLTGEWLVIRMFNHTLTVDHHSEHAAR